MLDFRVKTFLTVCQTLNYTTAARELHITQPAVSQHISYLEREYGTDLFTYGNRKLRLTKAGTVLRDVLSVRAHDDELLRRKLHALGSGARSHLRVGMTLTAGRYVAAQPLARYLVMHPEVQVTIRSGGTAHLLALLEEGSIDCAFVEGLFDRSAYACDAFSKERLVCACAADHALMGERASFDDLLGMQLLVREEGSGTRAVLEHALAEHNLSLNAFADVTEIGSLDIIKIFLAEGLGISFLYESAVRHELEEGALGLIRLKEKPIEHGISFIRLSDSAFEADLKGFFKEMKHLVV